MDINEVCIDEMISTPCARNTYSVALVLLSTHTKAICKVAASNKYISCYNLSKRRNQM